ncbi:MAG: peptidylprolyl isomerase, partial [Halioglobus sp.]|nr:peptidylprolyl isomerase [Halioglobus sp.]
MKYKVFGSLMCGLAMASVSGAFAQTAVEADGVDISRQEMQATVERWPANMREAAADDPAMARELATLSLVAKKIAQEADRLTPEAEPKFYWDMQLQVQMLKRRMMVKHYLDNIDFPDWEPLARERYEADKDKFARVGERRLASHILFMCSPTKCEYEDVGKLAEETLAALHEGADFEEMVAQHSDDTVTKGRGGEFRWVTLGQKGVSGEFTSGVFEIENVGDYSDVVNSEYGLHIIRLDGIEPQYYKPYAEVKARIIAEMEQEYRELAAIEFDRQYAPSDDLVIDDAGLQEILQPYKAPGKGNVVPVVTAVGDTTAAGSPAGATGSP